MGHHDVPWAGILCIPWTNVTEKMNSGIYLLVLKLDEPKRIKVGALGFQEFEAGYYVYVGSAMGGIAARLKRHTIENKTKKWHIDYLRDKADVVGFKKIFTEERIECEIAAKVKEAADSTPVKGFGSSDCGCESHLFYFKESPREKLENIK